MKTAEEWYQEYQKQKRDNFNHGTPRTLIASDGSLFRAIQADARDTALIEAAAECLKHNNSGEGVECHYSILSLLDNKY